LDSVSHASHPPMAMATRGMSHIADNRRERRTAACETVGGLAASLTVWYPAQKVYSTPWTGLATSRRAKLVYWPWVEQRVSAFGPEVGFGRPNLSPAWPSEAFSSVTVKAMARVRYAISARSVISVRGRASRF
jgi:hypothetical protein